MSWPHFAIASITFFSASLPIFLKYKKWIKQYQSGFKFYNMWCVKFIFETILTEMSKNVCYPHFLLFQMFTQVHLNISVWQDPKLFSQTKFLETNSETFFITNIFQTESKINGWTLKNIHLWWSNDVKTIEKPSKSTGGFKKMKTLIIPFTIVVVLLLSLQKFWIKTWDIWTIHSSWG